MAERRAYAVMVRFRRYDPNWRWAGGDISFPVAEWWRRMLWPDIGQARGAARYWRDGQWEAKVVKIKRQPAPKRSTE